jgi:hypothetical protein
MISFVISNWSLLNIEFWRGNFFASFFKKIIAYPMVRNYFYGENGEK